MKDFYKLQSNCSTEFNLSDLKGYIKLVNLNKKIVLNFYIDILIKVL